MPTSTSERRKPGPTPRGLMDTHIKLPIHLIDWAKRHEEGLSGLIRRLLREEFRREHGQETTQSET